MVCSPSRPNAIIGGCQAADNVIKVGNMCRKKFVNSLLQKRMCEVSLAEAEPFWNTTSHWA